MTDERIVELYWKRDESAVAETQSKYGRYLTKIAYNILTDMEDSLESVNDTYMHAWKSMPPHRPSVLSNNFFSTACFCASLSSIAVLT